MVERCQSWLVVVETLEKYLNAASVRYDWINEATSRLSREMPQPEDLGEQFASIGKGGIKDVFVKLWWDLNLPDGKAAESASKIIKEELLKETESLTNDLKRSISDFTDHSASFDASLAPSKTASLRDPKVNAQIEEYIRAVSAAEAKKQPEIDPYLLKLTLDRKIDRAVRKHNTQADAYAYVQDAAKRVDMEVTTRLQAILKQYTAIVERNGNIIAEGGRSIRSVFVNQPPLFEYKHWLQSNKAPSTFTGTTSEASKTRRSDNDLGYPKEDSYFSKAIRTGVLERRSKILRTYSPSDYALTPLSLIELRQNQPVWSIDLLGAKLLENDKANTEDQFVIEARQHGSSSGKLHKFVFRAKVAANWRRDIAAICSGHTPTSLDSLVRAQNSRPMSPVTSHKEAAPSYHEKPSTHDTVATPPVPVDVSEPQPAAPIVSTVAAPTSGGHLGLNERVSGLNVSETSSTIAPSARGEDPFADGRSLVGSDKAATGIAPPSHIATPASETPPPISRQTLDAASDSEVSEVDQAYDSLYRAASPEEGSVAWAAKRDMAVFEKPVGQ